jgi:hypothetical protein
MPAIIALALIALVALAVLGAAVHLLFSPGCWWPSQSWPGSSSGRAAPTGSPGQLLTGWPSELRPGDRRSSDPWALRDAASSP